MKFILDSCKTVSEIKEKRIRFDLDLRTRRITLDDSKPDLDVITKYNVEDKSILENLKITSEEKNRAFSEEDYHFFSKLFTRINYYRKGENDKPFEKIGYIFMTNSGFATYLARNATVKFGHSDVPFVEDIEFITTKFWFKLNKGLSDGQSLPKSSDVISKAKIILSSQLENRVSQRFQELKNNFKSGELSKEEAQQRNLVFRHKPLRPEEITAQNIDDSLDFLLDDNEYFENIQREKIYQEGLFTKTQIENERLKKELQLKNDAEQKELEKQKARELQQQKEEYIENKWMEEKQKNYKDLRYFLIVFTINIYLAVIAVPLVNADFRTWLFKFDSFCQFFIIGSYIIVLLVDYLGKSYLFDKDKIKNGWKWLRIILNTNKKFEIENNFRELSEKEFSIESESIKNRT